MVSRNDHNGNGRISFTAQARAADTLPEVYCPFELFDQNTGKHEGFLVAQAGDMTRMIAMVETRFSATRRGEARERGRAAATATDIAKAANDGNLDALDRSIWLDSNNAIDLRGYGRVDSTRPTPGRLYRYLAGPVGAGPQNAMPLFPYCPVRLTMMVRMHNRLHFSPEDLAEQTEATVGIESSSEGDGEFTTRKLSLDPVTMPLPL